jgi:hypothetical protein
MSLSIERVTPHLAHASPGTGNVKPNSGDFARVLAEVDDTGESKSEKPPGGIPIGEPPVGVPPPGSAGDGRGSVGTVGGERPGGIGARGLPVVSIGLIDFDAIQLPGPVGPPGMGAIESADVPSGEIDGNGGDVRVIPMGTLPVVDEVPKPGEAGMVVGRISEAWLLAQLEEERP